MIVECPKEERSILIHLFDEHVFIPSIVKSIIIEGWGNAYVDNLNDPKIGLVSYSSVNFLSGDFQNAFAKEILSFVPHHKLIFVPNNNWANLMREYWGFRLIEKKNDRTHFSSKDLDLNQIRKLKNNINNNFMVERINKDNSNKFGHLSEFFFSIFGSTDNFLDKGFGFCILDGDKVVCAAATGTPPYDNSFEIQVMTDKNYRRKGLATIACAYLIEFSLENGYNPCWDAANKRSVELALKLGYIEPVPYSYYFHAKLPLIILRKTKLNKLIGLIIKLLGKDPEA